MLDETTMVLPKSRIIIKEKNEEKVYCYNDNSRFSSFF